MSRPTPVQFDGRITEVLPEGKFLVMIQPDHYVTAHRAGDVRRYRIRLVLGDRVTVEVSPFDPTRGRIIYRVR